MLTCKLTVGRFEKTIDARFPQELIDLAALPLWVYINLKKKLGENKAFEIMRIAILTGGIAQWNLCWVVGGIATIPSQRLRFYSA
jgi:hypothetical protein